MSFCRFSSDDFQCDLYIYADVYGGYTTHVAANRVVFPKPLPKPIKLTKENTKPWASREMKVMKMMKTARRIPIKSPVAGGQFNDPTLLDLLKRVAWLGSLGFNYPTYVIDRIVDELGDEARAAAVKGIMRSRAGKYKSDEYRKGWLKGRDAAIEALKRSGEEE